jgi:sigma-B regulation protein RsbU (phosphoserine phosphatase)
MLKLTSIEKSYPCDWPLRPGKYIIGRGSDCDFVINNSTVSRHHAELIVDESGIGLKDLGSHNGTTVNCEKILDNAFLKENDEIYFGKAHFQIIKNNPEFPDDQDLGHGEIDLTRISVIPLDDKSRPLAQSTVDKPKTISVFSEMAKMLVLPELDSQMYDMALKLLSEIIPADRLAIYFISSSSEDLALAAQLNKSNKKAELFRFSRTIIKKIIDDRNAILISNLHSDSHFKNRESIIISGAQAIIAVPLFDENRILGILYADSLALKPNFNEEVLTVAVAFGNILAAKINNFHLLRERRIKEAYEAELALASHIQRQLLPQNLPQVHGYFFDAFQAQCLSVGGDLYDIVQLKDGRILFLMADVSGKGVSAALLAANILAAFRILYDTGCFDLRESVRQVSDQLLNHSRPGDFATLFAAILDPKSGRLSYINAGHNAPYLVRANCKVETMESTGIPIGIFGQTSWDEMSINLNSGDLLFIYTDGIPEATNDKGEQYGDDRLIDSLKSIQDASTLSESLNHEVNKFLGDSPEASDDITMIIIKREL